MPGPEKEVLTATTHTWWLPLYAGQGPKCAALLTHELLQHSAPSPMSSPIHRGAYPVTGAAGQVKIWERTRGRLLYPKALAQVGAGGKPQRIRLLTGELTDRLPPLGDRLSSTGWGAWGRR